MRWIRKWWLHRRTRNADPYQVAMEVSEPSSPGVPTPTPADSLRETLRDLTPQGLSDADLDAAIIRASRDTAAEIEAVDPALLSTAGEELDAWLQRIGPEGATTTHTTYVRNLGRAIGDVVSAHLRNMAGTKMYLAYTDLTPDQQRWFDELEEDWMMQLGGVVPDLHLTFDEVTGAWQVRSGSTAGQILPMKPDFKIGSWGPASVNIKRRLAHLFLDRNRISGTLHVYRKSGALFEKDIVTPKPASR